ncbi:microviridin/marinostatin family tricyclic proteinase inhibitor [Chryseobacterium sp. JAH]|uniref:microviridin/marinostatin family tricyclic proteinase inhibitor n=1 Tax=Chryseobacterium sp. JAH TaxID=1742858 RepID=UPI0006480988|nr:microviridin/marinostatin family tricyclic proteinase inhibitor [Chryseobacterium sp. JAH]KUJ52615.1 serine endopeptidase [Chryseobacterium sp. JAH]
MEKKKLKKPFFASFLESQIKDSKEVKGGSTSFGATTPLKDGVTKPSLDSQQTMKYPSDGDESTV